MNLLEFTSTIHYYVNSNGKPRLSKATTLIAIEHLYRTKHMSYIRSFLEEPFRKVYKDV